MLKKTTLLFMFIVFIITISGCETAKNAGRALKRVDEWMQKSLW
ncbi:MAG: hypothetical protein Q8R31_05225 [Candidatus Omnitrophota bacterium]|nr:hypothetical protein [Candidatus Omnitrophota bacterium]